MIAKGLLFFCGEVGKVRFLAEIGMLCYANEGFMHVCHIGLLMKRKPTSCLAHVSRAVYREGRNEVCYVICRLFLLRIVRPRYSDSCLLLLTMALGNVWSVGVGLVRLGVNGLTTSHLLTGAWHGTW